jgi:hypothetical protein
LQQKSIEIASLCEKLESRHDEMHKVYKESESTSQELNAIKADLTDAQNQLWNLSEELRHRDQQIQILTANSREPCTFYIKNDNTGVSSGSRKPPKDYDAELWTIFIASDPHNTCKLDTGQLQFALARGQWPPISIKTSWSLMRIADPQGDFVGVEQFPALWSFVEACKATFVSHDKQKTSETVWGYVGSDEIPLILASLGLKMPKKALSLVSKRLASEGIFNLI